MGTHLFGSPCISRERYHEFWQIISSRLYVPLKQGYANVLVRRPHKLLHNNSRARHVM